MRVENSNYYNSSYDPFVAWRGVLTSEVVVVVTDCTNENTHKDTFLFIQTYCIRITITALTVNAKSSRGKRDEKHFVEYVYYKSDPFLFTVGDNKLSIFIDDKYNNIIIMSSTTSLKINCCSCIFCNFFTRTSAITQNAVIAFAIQTTRDFLESFVYNIFHFLI